MTSLRLSLFVLFLSLPAFVLAGEFTPLTTAPGFNEVGEGGDLSGFLNLIYKICVGAAAALAILQIIRAGIIYMLGDSITEKKEAKDLIAAAIFGLILVLSPYIVFSIINPDILSLQVDVSGLDSETGMQAAAPDTILVCQSVRAGTLLNAGSANLCGSCSNGALRAVPTRTGNVRCAGADEPTPPTAGQIGQDADGNYYIDVGMEPDRFVILRTDDTEDAECTAVQYSSYGTQAECQAAAAAAPAPDGWYTTYDCVENAISTTRLSSNIRPFCGASSVGN